MEKKTANEAPCDVAVVEGKIKVGDGRAFKKIVDICPYFGIKTPPQRTCFITIDKERHLYLWCPKLPGTKGWLNELPGNGGNFFEGNVDPNALRKDDGVTRITFAGRKESGQMTYRFIGVYVDDDDHRENSDSVKVYKRTAQEIDLTPWCETSEKK